MIAVREGAPYLPAGLPLPLVNRTNAGFWRAAAQGRLDVQRCTECGAHRHPPTEGCYRCRALDSEWDRLPGTGRVFTYTWWCSSCTRRWGTVAPYNVRWWRSTAPRGSRCSWSPTSSTPRRRPCAWVHGSRWPATGSKPTSACPGSVWARHPGMRVRAALVAAFVAASSLGGCASGDFLDLRPNVVVIMTDDQTVESMRVMPNVRELLAERGVTFTNSFVSYPLCCPSRATLLTGQYAHNHGVLGNEPPDGGYGALERERTTLPAALQDAGYTT
ncbi:MAG: sulfatase-like hydrolase/transferase, partial [Actinobacteria bacterium]|nr:sulfatase-like hydrolase/transferase [Actinomycetota bacterium]